MVPWMTFLSSIRFVHHQELQWADSVFALWESSALIAQINGNLFWLSLYILLPVLMLFLLGFLSWSMRQRRRAVSDSRGGPEDVAKGSAATDPTKSPGRPASSVGSKSPGASQSNHLESDVPGDYQREPEFSDFDFDDDSTEIEIDVGTNGTQGFDLAAPENSEFDSHQGGEQEDLLDEMYREDEQLSGAESQDDSGFQADDTDVEEEDPQPSPPPKKKPQFQTHDEFHVGSDLPDDDDMDLSDDTEQDFDTCLEADGLSASSDSFGELGAMTSRSRSDNVLDDEEEKRSRSRRAPEDTAVGLDVSELEMIDETLQLLESANAELEKLKRLNKDLLDDRAYLNSQMQQNEKVIEQLSDRLEQSRNENEKNAQAAAELRKKSEQLKDEVEAAKDKPSELQTKLLSELRTELVESQQHCEELESQLNSAIRDRDQVQKMLSDAEMSVPESVLAEIKILTEQVESLKAERNRSTNKAAENGKPE